MDKEKVEDLKVLLEMLLLPNEYLYTITLNKIKVILDDFIGLDSNLYLSNEIIEYNELKMNIYIDLKVGLAHLTRKINPPYRISYYGDFKYHKRSYKERLLNVLISIHKADTLYGALSNTNEINWSIVKIK